MSFIEKYSPVEPESALALCDVEFVLVTVENDWTGAVDGK
jgi:hypothetical protein